MDVPIVAPIIEYARELNASHGAMGLFCAFLIWRLWLADAREERKDARYDAVMDRYIADMSKFNRDQVEATHIFDKVIGKIGG